MLQGIPQSYLPDYSISSSSSSSVTITSFWSVPGSIKLLLGGAHLLEIFHSIATTIGAGASVRVLILGLLLLSSLCLQVAAVSSITNLATVGKIYVFDKELASGKSVTIPLAQLSNVKLSRELNGAFGLVPLKDRRSYLLINNGETGNSHVYLRLGGSQLYYEHVLV